MAVSVTGPRAVNELGGPVTPGRHLLRHNISGGGGGVGGCNGNMQRSSKFKNGFLMVPL